MTSMSKTFFETSFVVIKISMYLLATICIALIVAYYKGKNLISVHICTICIGATICTVTQGVH